MSYFFFFLGDNIIINLVVDMHFKLTDLITCYRKTQRMLGTGQSNP